MLSKMKQPVIALAFLTALLAAPAFAFSKQHPECGGVSKKYVESKKGGKTQLNAAGLENLMVCIDSQITAKRELEAVTGEVNAPSVHNCDLLSETFAKSPGDLSIDSLNFFMECLSDDYKQALQAEKKGAVYGGNISARKVDREIPTDPFDDFWKEGTFVAFEMDPQMITNPMWPNPSTRWLHVKAARNQKDIALMLTWIDSTRNDEMIKSEQYKDQAAIMFPVNQQGEEPPFTMGGDGEWVNIWQWKATWEASAKNDGEEYFPEPDMDMEKGFKGQVESYNPGKVSGNIFADSSIRRSPIEDMNAEGFSTLTTQDQQDIDGSGKWLNSRWSVVFKRALVNNDENDSQFTTTKTPIAFAIWNGGNKERNGQKAVTQFHILEY